MMTLMESAATRSDPAEIEQILQARLRPSNLHFTLAFAGLFQMTHEMLKYAVLSKVRECYTSGFDEKGAHLDRAAYRREVLGLTDSGDGRTNAFHGSVRWLVNAGAITDDDAARLEAVYSYRHELTHEIQSVILDLRRELDAQLFVDAALILKKIHMFWVRVELDSGGFYVPELDDWVEDVDPNDVHPISEELLWLCASALMTDGGEEDEPLTDGP